MLLDLAGNYLLDNLSYFKKNYPEAQDGTTEEEIVFIKLCSAFLPIGTPKKEHHKAH